jgi:hypothetical protein
VPLIMDGTWFLLAPFWIYPLKLECPSLRQIPMEMNSNTLLYCPLDDIQQHQTFFPPFLEQVFREIFFSFPPRIFLTQPLHQPHWVQAHDHGCCSFWASLRLLNIFLFQLHKLIELVSFDIDFSCVQVLNAFEFEPLLHTWWH